jgi:hypothetical protein
LFKSAQERELERYNRDLMKMKIKYPEAVYRNEIEARILIQPEPLEFSFKVPKKDKIEIKQPGLVISITDTGDDSLLISGRFTPAVIDTTLKIADEGLIEPGELEFNTGKNSGIQAFKTFLGVLGFLTLLALIFVVISRLKGR